MDDFVMVIMLALPAGLLEGIFARQGERMPPSWEGPEEAADSFGRGDQITNFGRPLKTTSCIPTYRKKGSGEDVAL